jgi:isopenicillin N synthase-like dioxygenase
MAMAPTVSSQNQIPVIDISRTDSGSELEIAERLVEAATIHGFVYIKNLGYDIPIKEIGHAFDLVKSSHGCSFTC